MNENKPKQTQYGKGSKRRVENFKAIQNNWDSINWGNKKKKVKEKCHCDPYQNEVCDVCQEKRFGKNNKDKT
jgi:hypothetical protein